MPASNEKLLATIRKVLEKYRQKTPVVRAERSHPVVDFEIRSRIGGIAQLYRFPGGLAARDIEDFVFMAAALAAEDGKYEGWLLTALAELWSEIVVLNPDLSSLRPEGLWPLYAALLAVASCFNPEDTGVLILLQTGAFEKNETHTALEELLRLRGVCPGWPAAYATLLRIKEYTDRRGKQKAGQTGVMA